MTELLTTLSIIFFALAGVFLIIAVVLWFFFKIPVVIGDLTGRTARKSIAQMRQANEKSGKGRRERKNGVAGEKRYDRMHKSDTSGGQKKADDHERLETGLLEENQMSGYASEETALLWDAEAATEGEETTLLAEEEETASLAAPDKKRSEDAGGVKLTVLDEVLLVYTDENVE